MIIMAVSMATGRHGARVHILILSEAGRHSHNTHTHKEMGEGDSGRDGERGREKERAHSEPTL